MFITILSSFLSQCRSYSLQCHAYVQRPFPSIKRQINLPRAGRARCIIELFSMAAIWCTQKNQLKFVVVTAAAAIVIAANKSTL